MVTLDNNPVLVFVTQSHLNHCHFARTSEFQCHLWSQVTSWPRKPYVSWRNSSLVGEKTLKILLFDAYINPLNKSQGIRWQSMVQLLSHTEPDKAWPGACQRGTCGCVWKWGIPPEHGNCYIENEENLWLTSGLRAGMQFLDKPRYSWLFCKEFHHAIWVLTSKRVGISLIHDGWNPQNRFLLIFFRNSCGFMLTS